MKLTEIELSLLGYKSESEVSEGDIKKLIHSNLEVLQYLDPIDDESEITTRAGRVKYLKGLIK